MGFQPLRKLKGLFKSRSTLSLYENDVVTGNGSEVCLECNEAYNMGKKRKLIDVCGHTRCLTCVTQHDNCKLCGQDPQQPAKKSLPIRQSQKYYSENSRLSCSNSPVPIPVQRSIAKSNGLYSHGKAKSGLSSLASSLYGSPRPFRLTSIARGKGSSPVLQQKHQKQENENLGQKTPRSTLGRKSALTISRIQENEISSSSPISEHDEGFEDIRKFKSFDSGHHSTSNSTYSRLERYLSKRILQKSPSRMGRHSTSQLHTSCSSLTSSVGSVTPSEQNAYLSPSRASYETNSLAHHHRLNGISAISTPINEIRHLSYPHRPPVRYPSTVRQEQLPLRPLFFEVPIEEEDSVFVGRQSLFHQMEMLLSNEINSNRGIIISGKAGSGKTRMVVQLVEHSCFGRLRNLDLDLRYSSSAYEDDLSSYSSYPESIRSLASHIVAYQFCQVENNISCLVPEFLHSVAAQLCQAPQLSAYREYLLEMPACQNYLSKAECLRNPTEALMKGILEPLNYLYKINKISNDFLVIVIDSVCEAEFHRSDSGDTIASFLSKNILKFPCWLKVIITVRSQHQTILSLIPFYRIKLDENEEGVAQDLFDYVTFRMKKNSLKKNVSFGSKNESTQFSFVKRLIKLASGNYLFAKLTLDLIEDNHLHVTSPDFKELPKSLSEVFLKFCNSIFPTEESFSKVATIFSVCLAALNPLTILEIYHSVNCLNSTERMTWESFIDVFKGCSRLLLKRSDGTHMMLHSTFRDWLIQREDSEDKKFFCDLRIGHAAIALRFSRIEAPLNGSKTLELGHHILKAHIYKNSPSTKMMAPPRDLQALWLANCSSDLSATLASPANIYYPNVKVSRLLLLAGANPNELTEWRSAPLLSICAGEGLCEMASLLLEFGANINGVDEDGNTALHLAAENGQLEMVRLLIQQGALISQVNHEGECALVKAAIANRLPVVAFLLHQNWNDVDVALPSSSSSTSSSSLLSSPNSNSNSNANMNTTTTPTSKPLSSVTEAAQHALVAASAYGNVDIVQHIIEEMNAPVNCPDTLYGENPLCISCAQGRENVVELLLENGASVNAVNMRDCPPLILAASGGHASIIKRLLEEGAAVNRTDASKRTALIMAAKEGHVDALELLITAGANINIADKDGLSALSWAALRGHTVIVQSLLTLEDIVVNHADISGRTPLDLASYCGSEEISQLLLGRGALLEHVDLQGARALDRAVSCGHIGVVQLFLKKGAKLGPSTWMMAAGKPDIILALLNKLLEDGNVLYRKGQLKDAVYRYSYAVRKIPVNEYDEDMQNTFDEIKCTIMLALSRCKRKMNEEEEAINLASEVIKMRPNSPKAYQVRAKSYQAIKEITQAVNDVHRAMELVGHNSELQRQLSRLKEELSREARHETSRNSTSPRFLHE